MNQSRRQFGGALVGLSAGLTFHQTALATSARPWPLEDLVAASDRSIVATAVAARSEWMFLGGAERIVTFTRVLQEQDYLNDSQEDELEILTLGGRVGSILQKVPGSAQLTVGQGAVLFVGGEQSHYRMLIGMAQGHFTIDTSNETPLLRKSRHVAHLFARKDRPEISAGTTLDGRTLSEARGLIQGARAR